MEEQQKLERIKKSCNTGKKVTFVLFIIAIVGSVLCLFASISIFCMKDSVDTMVQKGIDDGHITVGNTIGSVKAFNIDLGGINNFHSDVPAIEKALKDHPYSIVISIYSLVATVCLIVMAVMLKLINSVFALIIKEENPFTDKVIQKVMVVMIAFSVIMLMAVGLGFGVLSGVVTWVVYTILDYGKQLQIQADETL